jgi:hypothetical protein
VPLHVDFDVCRCNAHDLTASLETLCSILLENQLCLPMLPLLSMWEHTALHVTHQMPSVVWCRIMRVKTLAQLGMLAEAGSVLQDLLRVGMMVLCLSASGLQGSTQAGRLFNKVQMYIAWSCLLVSIYHLRWAAAKRTSHCQCWVLMDYRTLFQIHHSAGRQPAREAPVGTTTHVGP